MFRCQRKSIVLGIDIRPEKVNMTSSFREETFWVITPPTTGISIKNWLYVSLNKFDMLSWEQENRSFVYLALQLWDSLPLGNVWKVNLYQGLPCTLPASCKWGWHEAEVIMLLDTHRKGLRSLEHSDAKRREDGKFVWWLSRGLGNCNGSHSMSCLGHPKLALSVYSASQQLADTWLEVYRDRRAKKWDGLIGRELGFLLLSSCLTRKESSNGTLVLSGWSTAGCKIVGEFIYMLSHSLWPLIGAKAAWNETLATVKNCQIMGFMEE